MAKRILLVGGGGHCKSVLDSLLELDEYSEIGIIDVKENVGKEIMNTPVIGCDEDLFELFAKGYKHAFVTIGSIGDPKLRIKIFNLLIEIGFEIPNIIDHSATVSRHVKMGNGIYIGKNAVINAGSFIYDGAIINSLALIEHDCVIEEFAHIAPGSILCGEVQIGKETHIGAKSVIKQQIRIGSKTVIGMGSIVLNDIRDNIIAFGNPCKEVKSK
ncbi:acetyltransferase [Robertmurraya sp. GLU-23]